MSEEQAKDYVDKIQEDSYNAKFDIDLKRLGKQVITIISELFKLKPGISDHPATKDFFNWLVDPQRTEREFHYAIVDLREDISVKAKKVVPYDKYGYAIYGSYLGKIAMEALAVICPILEGYWERIAWVLIIGDIGSSYDKDAYGIASKRLSSWLVHIIGDQDICPNVTLRVWFMSLLYQMTDPNDFNKEQALDSIFFTCSTLNIEKRDVPLDNIKYTLKMIAEDGFLLEFGNKFAAKLLDMKVSRLSALVNDVSQKSSIKPFCYSHQIVFNGLFALLRYLSQRARLALAEDFSSESRQNMDTESDEIVYLYQVILENFKESLRTPQLDDQVFLYEKDIKELYNATNFEGYVVRRDRYNHINCSGCPDCPTNGVLVNGVIYPDLASAP